MKAIINGKLVLPCEIVSSKVLVFDEKIQSICDKAPEGAELIDAKGNYVLPGLVDIHIHGYLGEHTSHGSAEGIRKMAEGVAKNGVTSWLPTTMTVSYAELEKAFDAVRFLMKKENNPTGAQILGVNAEGPFINPSKKGAQAEENIRPADADFIIKHSDIIRLFTIAPEMPGALDCIKKVTAETKVVASMGHTGAKYTEAMDGVAAGARHVTHLFNAQSALNHRDPGVAGAGLICDKLSCELIADTFHISSALFEMIGKLKEDKLVLITDCTRAGGLADGEYTLGGQPFFVKGIECRLADGTIAGSVLKLNAAIRNMKANTSFDLCRIVRMASLNPASVIGEADRKGSLEAGKDADIAILDEDFNVMQTIIAGETVYKA